MAACCDYRLAGVSDDDDSFGVIVSGDAGDVDCRGTGPPAVEWRFGMALGLRGNDSLAESFLRRLGVDISAMLDGGLLRRSPCRFLCW